MADIKFCPKCGAKIDGPAGKFCDMCGADLTGGKFTRPGEPGKAAGLAGIDRRYLIGGVAVLIIAIVLLFPFSWLGGSPDQKGTAPVQTTATVPLPTGTAPSAVSPAATTGGTSPTLKIVSATYGYQGKTIDVTARLSSLISDNRITISVTNDNLGSDPAYGYGKTLTVVYQNPQGTFTIEVPEYQNLEISLSSTG